MNNGLENSVNYAVTFARNSPAMGVLLVMLYEGLAGIDFNRSMYIVQDRENSASVNQIFNLPGGRYRVLVYDVESSGMLNSDTMLDSSEPAVRSSVQVSGDAGSRCLLILYIMSTICNS